MQTVFVAKSLVLDSQGKFLLLTRSDTHPFYAGFADLPGGKIEPGEEPGVAVAREVHEETGMKIQPEDLRVIYAVTKEIGGASYPTLLYAVQLQATEPEVAVSWEHASYEWAPLARLAEVEPQIAPTYREALEYVQANGILADTN